MQKSAFYAALRERDSGIFGTSLSQRQVDGLEALLTALRGLSVEHAAHVLAECYHETGRTMWPVEENLNYSKRRIPQVFGPHRLQGIPPAKLARNPVYLANTVYGGEWGKTNLGNIHGGDGWKFRGMGIIQQTGRRNAERASALTGFDLVKEPERMLNPQVSAEIAVEGCRAGMWRGHKLADFDRVQGYDHRAARAIVNADVPENGPKVERYALAFEKALKAARWGELPPVRPDVEPPAPRAREVPETRSPGGLAGIIKLIIERLISWRS